MYAEVQNPAYYPLVSFYCFSLLMQHLVLMGIQWSGKGTQAQKIVENFWYTLFETGAELRKIAKENTTLGTEIRETIEAGHYVPARCIRDVITDFIAKNPGKKLLFDSPIRSHEQDAVIRPILGKFTTVHLELDPQTAIDRLLHRRIDSVTGEVFPADFPLEYNPRTNNPLITRKDDNPESIKNRIDYSLNETLPIVRKWESEWLRVFHIDAENTIDEVFVSLQNLLHSFL